MTQEDVLSIGDVCARAERVADYAVLGRGGPTENLYLMDTLCRVENVGWEATKMGIVEIWRRRSSQQET